MLDSRQAGQCMEPHYERTHCGECLSYVATHRLELTLHEAFFDNLAEPLHLGFWQVFALFGLLQPLVRPRAFRKARGPGLRNIAVSPHVYGILQLSGTKGAFRCASQIIRRSNGGEQDSRVTAAAMIIRRDVARVLGNICGWEYSEKQCSNEGRASEFQERGRCWTCMMRWKRGPSSRCGGGSCLAKARAPALETRFGKRRGLASVLNHGRCHCHLPPPIPVTHADREVPANIFDQRGCLRAEDLCFRAWINAPNVCAFQTPCHTPLEFHSRLIIWSYCPGATLLCRLPLTPRAEMAPPAGVNGVLSVTALQKNAPASAPRGPKIPAPRLKLICRRLPPGLTRTEFETFLGEEWKVGAGRVDWLNYRKGKISKEYAPPHPSQSTF